MFETINTKSKVAVYIQIKNLVQYAIATGRLKAGDQLQTIHGLSEQLGINFNTVSKAYRDLEVMGLVHTRRGEGVFVKNGIGARCRKECQSRIVARMRDVIAEAMAAGFTAVEVRKAAEAGFAGTILADSFPPTKADRAKK